MNYFNKFIAFVREQYHTNDFVPLHEPRFRGNEKRYLLETIDSTFVSSVGAYVDQFERNMEQFTKATKAVAVVNGTAALQVALRLVGVSKGDEVITQALSFIATSNAISYNNAIPVFLDVDFDTMGLSPKAVRHFLENNAELREDGAYNKFTGNRISACVPMHTFGFPVHLDELITVCSAWKIPVVEDAAESLGSYYKEHHTGTIGQVGCFSFNGNKTITCGGGGAIVSNDLDLGTKAKYLTTTAKKPHPYEFFHDEIGYNYRMPNLNAALACAQMEMLTSFLADKRKLAEEYAKFFQSAGVNFRRETPQTRANYWLMCVELNNILERDDFLKETNANGIMTRPIWTLTYRLPMYQHCYRDEQVNAEFLEQRIVNIPSSVR
ncbi:LegC family aminotransferase [Sphingobacterium sp. InxBP1]|uniref:LegC family aminotransferase n=1 Tax=Sphingobacterium sp. InxBP1 TaxID=2870328 RepID=UPI00224378D3|nr:LegC family aminotransferase [Sphingobacterium sp. InxBP1]MCW8310908.1 LegC family aminotransferase [Sphingobacterium sp. InxBP1]